MARQRWRLDIAYDGTDFAGWASQLGQRSVQGELEHWITTVLRLDDPVRLTCAGRTDAGVHARGQVAHLDLDPDLITRPARDSDGDHDGPTLLHRRLRRALPPDIAVHRVSPAPDGFDARFSAIWRRYCYRIADADTAPDPLQRRHLTMINERLAPELITGAARSLLGLHDFAAFCKRRDGATTVRTLTECSAGRRDDGVVEVWLTADAFCHSMVRSVVGALVVVASGRRDADWLSGLTTAARRSGEISVLPPTGLVLEQVGYPEDDRLAERALEARAVRTLP